MPGNWDIQSPNLLGWPLYRHHSWSSKVSKFPSKDRDRSATCRLKHGEVGRVSDVSHKTAWKNCLERVDVRFFMIFSRFKEICSQVQKEIVGFSLRTCQYTTRLTLFVWVPQYWSPSSVAKTTPMQQVASAASEWSGLQALSNRYVSNHW